MESIFMRYRIFFYVLCILLLLYFPHEVYKGITCFTAGKPGQGTGTLLNACITYLFVPIYIPVTIKKLHKKELSNS